jgi:hypothetical protein
MAFGLRLVRHFFLSFFLSFSATQCSAASVVPAALPVIHYLASSSSHGCTPAAFNAKAFTPQRPMKYNGTIYMPSGHNPMRAVHVSSNRSGSEHQRCKSKLATQHPQQAQCMAACTGKAQAPGRHLLQSTVNRQPKHTIQTKKR